MSKKLIITIYILIIIIAAIIIKSEFIYLITHNVLGLKINFSTEFNKYVNSKIILVISVITLIFIYKLIEKEKFFNKIRIYTKNIIEEISIKLNVKTLIIAIFTYIVPLILLAVVNYDLGFDEAWYVHYAINYSKSFVGFYMFNEKVSIVSIMEMLPYQIIYYFYGLFTRIELTDVKIISSILSYLGLIIIYKVIYKQNNKEVGWLTLFFIVIQPGFGFVSSSFFGEIFAASLIMLAMNIYYNNKNNIYQNILSGIILATAIHTKMQLLPIIVICIILMAVIEKDKRIIKTIIYAVLIFVVIALLRVIPAFTNNIASIYSIIKQYYHLSSGYHKELTIGLITDRIQLFNRFYPLMLFSITAIFSYPLLKPGFDKFVYLFSLTMIIYWIFLFNFITYRHLFIGIIPMCYLNAKLVYYFYNKLKVKNYIPLYKLKLIFATGFAFIYIYGVSTNIVYAYIGYNDGVQFDLDGYKSRLFTEIKRDKTQVDFYDKVKPIIEKENIVFSPSPHLAKVYLGCNVYTIDMIDKIEHTGNKYIIISRETYLDMNEGFDSLKNSGVNYEKVLNVGDFYLLKYVQQSK